MAATYCGNNALHPGLASGDLVIGNRYQCLKKGIGVGLNIRPVDPDYDGPYKPIDTTKRYCGLQDKIPPGYDSFGTNGECLRLGVGIGKRSAAERANRRRAAMASFTETTQTNAKISYTCLSLYVIFSYAIIFLLLYWGRPSIILTKNKRKRYTVSWFRFFVVYLCLIVTYTFLSWLCGIL